MYPKWKKGGDLSGKFTFISKSNGASTVDFAITSENLYDDVSNFVVNPQAYLSDHSQINPWISENKIKISNKSDLTHENDTYKLPIVFCFKGNPISILKMHWIVLSSSIRL